MKPSTVLLYGCVAEGFSCIGPFASWDEARAWAEKRWGKDPIHWEIMDLDSKEDWS